MKVVHLKPGVIKYCTEEKLISFKRNNQLMEGIQKSLNTFLEKKRKEFPRFYFISNTEMLDLMSKDKEIPLIEPFMPNLFEGIAKFDVNPDSHESIVCGMISRTGEKVPFTRPPKFRKTFEIEVIL
jgi:dynein heavy chain